MNGVHSSASSELEIVTAEDGVRFWVRAKPRSSRSQLLGVAADGCLEVALTAPPVEGAANAELLKLLARALGVKKAAVSLRSGLSSRRKGIVVSGLSEAAVRRALVADKT